MAQPDLAHDDLLALLHELANTSLALWSVPTGTTARLINVSENATYLVEGPGGFKSVLRVHRENYHTQRAIECELLWMDALNRTGTVETPDVILGRDGKAVQKGGLAGCLPERFMVMFMFVEGEQPDESLDLAGPFEGLGAMAANTHLHTIAWQRPEPFERLTWDMDAFYGVHATWGNWRNGPNIDASTKLILERVERTVVDRVTALGKGADNYGLIHADMRLANLLIHNSETRLIDFDDCGFGWFLYDFAASISFIEDDPQIPAMRDAWVCGYRSVRPMSDAEECEIDSFIMLRRMALLAWIGSHIDVPEAQALSPSFACVSAELGEVYLSKMA